MPWLLGVSEWGESSIQPAEALQLVPPSLTAGKAGTQLPAQPRRRRLRAEAFVRRQSEMQRRFRI